MWIRSVLPLNGTKVNGHSPSLSPEFEDFTPPPSCLIWYDIPAINVRRATSSLHHTVCMELNTSWAGQEVQVLVRWICTTQFVSVYHEKLTDGAKDICIWGHSATGTYDIFFQGLCPIWRLGCWKLRSYIDKEKPFKNVSLQYCWYYARCELLHKFWWKTDMICSVQILVRRFHLF